MEDSCRETGPVEDSSDTSMALEDSGRETGPQDSRDTAALLKFRQRDWPKQHKHKHGPAWQIAAERLVQTASKLAQACSSLSTWPLPVQQLGQSSHLSGVRKPEIKPRSVQSSSQHVRKSAHVEAQVKRDAELAAMLSTFSDDDMGSQDETGTQCYSV